MSPRNLSRRYRGRKRWTGLLLATGLCWIAAGAAAADPARLLPSPVSESDFLPFDEKAAALGRLLFYDPVLSGNRNISCGTCHHHSLAGADGLALGVGEGGAGLGPERETGSGDTAIERRVPRNAPALFNLGHRAVRVLFHDGRLSIDDLYGNGFNSPAEEYLPPGLSNIVAAQVLFPLASETEMAGNPEENEIGGARNNRIDTVWPIVVERLRAIPAYVDLFVEAYPDVKSGLDIDIVHVANAIADFENSEWRSYDSAFDRFLDGDATAMSDGAIDGMRLFYGKAKCAACHSGPLLTDQEFHALALPQFGPGRTRSFDLIARDVGRMGETDRIEDAYRFRTPSLRNAALTAPYGHNGAYPTLEGMIRHHLDPVAALEAWSPSLVDLPYSKKLSPLDFIIRQDHRETERARRRIDIETMDLNGREVLALVAFVKALTGSNTAKGRLGRPDTVPSGLPVD